MPNDQNSPRDQNVPSDRNDPLDRLHREDVDPSDAPRPDRTWRVVDMVVAAVLAVAGGLLLWAFGASYALVTVPLAFYAPASALVNGLFVLPGVLGGLVVRKPGAAVFTELVAATVEGLLGSQWGFSTVYYGLLEGLGAEIVFALLLYRHFCLRAAIGAGMGAGVAMGLLDITIAYPAYPVADKVVYVVLSILSSAVLAGVLGWSLTRALARSGALAPLASGRAAERV